ncbi:MAG: hypothetical protein KY442_10000, partial [Proteobacteria bacterium]|nr:hypothetical protein [Pseudomonadota bacterium]
DDGRALWLGTSQALHLIKPLDAVVLWRPGSDEHHAHALVREALSRFEQREAAHPQTGHPVLRLQIEPGDTAGSGQ